MKSPEYLPMSAAAQPMAFTTTWTLAGKRGLSVP